MYNGGQSQLADTYAAASQIAPLFKTESVIDIELFSKVSALQFGEFENILGIRWVL